MRGFVLYARRRSLKNSCCSLAISFIFQELTSTTLRCISGALKFFSATIDDPLIYVKSGSWVGKSVHILCSFSHFILNPQPITPQRHFVTQYGDPPIYIIIKVSKKICGVIPRSFLLIFPT